MNKLFTKVAALTLGVAMAAGVGVAVGSSHKVSAAEATDVEKTTNDLATEYSWTTSSGSTIAGIYTSFALDDVITISTSGEANCGTIWDNSGTKDWRIYQNKSGDVTATAATGYKIDSVTYTYGVKNSGTLKDGDTTIPSGTTVAVNASSKTLTVGNTGSATNGNVQIKKFKVVYSVDGGTLVTSYSVTDSLEHGSVSPSSVNEGAKLIATITPDTGYELPGTLTDVTMGGSSVVYSYNNSTGVVEVSNVTGNIVISGSCPEKQATVLPNGNYSASLTYASTLPSTVDVLNSNSEKVAVLDVSGEHITYENNEYKLDANGAGYITLTNTTNARFTKVVFDIYNYDNLTVKADGVDVHVGQNVNGGDHNMIEIDNLSATQTINVVSNNKYQAKIYAITAYLKVGNDTTHVTGVSLNVSAGKVFTGLTRQLVATVSPADADDKSVSWSCEPESVATVDQNGLVTGVAAGEAVVTVTTTDGSFTAQFAATVEAINYGSENAPLTVEEAREVLEASGSGYSAQEVYVYGVVSSSKYYSNNSNYTIWLQSSDGETAKYFELYKALIPTPIGESAGADQADDAIKGQTVIAHGYGQIYGGTYELTTKDSSNPSVAKYEAPQPATYEVSFYEGNTGGGSQYAEGAKVTIPQPTESLIPEGKEFDYWEHKETGDHYAPGDEFTVGTSSARFDAVYKDAAPVAYWSDELLAAFQSSLHGVVPTYADSVSGLEYVSDYDDFELDSSDLETASAQLATLCSGWSFDGEGADIEYHIQTQDQLGYAVGYLYQSGDTYSPTLQFDQTAYEQEMQAAFAAKMHNNIPPFLHKTYAQFTYVDAASMFCSNSLLSNKGLTMLQTKLTNLGFALMSEAATGTRYVVVAQGGISGTVYQYGANCKDGGIMVVELFVMDEYSAMSANVYYSAQPVSIALSGEYKTVFEYGEEFDSTGIIVTATMSDETELDVTQYASFAGYDASVSGQQTITVTVGNAETSYVVTVNEPAPVYDADAFAKELLEKVAPICANYDGKKNNRNALKEVWTEMAVKYGTLSEEEKAKVVAAAAKADGTDLEKAMAFYNFACKKYGLTKFIAGRQVKAIVNEPVQNNSILPIIVIVASSVAAVTAIGVVIALKRRKSLLTK